MAILQSLEAKTEPGWRYRMRVNESGTVTAIFWQSPLQVELAKRYGDVVINDNSYNRVDNQYPLNIGIVVDGHNSSRNIWYCFQETEDMESFTWIMQAYLGCEGDNIAPPEVFISDRHASLIGAVRDTMPFTFHVYCLHHLEGNVHKNLRLKLGSDWAGFNTAFWSAYRAVSPEEFDKQWDAIVLRFPDIRDYLQSELYSCREHWAWAWTMINDFKNDNAYIATKWLLRLTLQQKLEVKTLLRVRHTGTRTGHHYLAILRDGHYFLAFTRVNSLTFSIGMIRARWLQNKSLNVGAIPPVTCSGVIYRNDDLVSYTRLPPIQQVNPLIRDKTAPAPAPTQTVSARTVYHETNAWLKPLMEGVRTEEDLERLRERIMNLWLVLLCVVLCEADKIPTDKIEKKILLMLMPKVDPREEVLKAGVEAREPENVEFAASLDTLELTVHTQLSIYTCSSRIPEPVAARLCCDRANGTCQIGNDWTVGRASPELTRLRGGLAISQPDDNPAKGVGE
ncbi:hypothetical protein D9758_017709 [Tetrapyrgos nigripes]|uniref:MULE transposase domain-containing protein n=1 Tax=Tetrapyrgos nigripes TaxID=182062 RepID=A0A8H5C7W8_9AGAR|nr:hypothetical protein D9758_017709 [Tetrapyrgos nigripes]